MKLLKTPFIESFDIAIYGLGYETRSIAAYEKYRSIANMNVVLGYKSNQDVLNYQNNRRIFETENLLELDCEQIEGQLKRILMELRQKVDKPNVLIDITVMTRHRLAVSLRTILINLPEGSMVTICYNASKYVEPPNELQPVRKVGPLIKELSGELGDLSSSTAVIFGLGYEELKALGVYNYLDPDISYAFIPTSENKKFECDVRKNNKNLLGIIADQNINEYNIYSPFDLYIDLKSLVLSLNENARVIIVPLGPKILSAMSLIIGMELSPEVPVWRVSSLHSELPVDRLADREVLQTIKI